MIIRTLLLITALVSTPALSATAGTISVPGDYATIQEAIDSSQAGDTILVNAATYNENITIGHALTLIGTFSAPDSTKLVAPTDAPAVSIQASNVAVLNLIVIGADGQNPSDPGGTGIDITNGTGVVLTQVLVYAGNGADGNPVGDTPSGLGGNAIVCQNATVSMQNSTIQAGAAGDALNNFTDGTFGGHGILSGGSQITVISSDVTGGPGGNTLDDITGALGGDGIRMNGGSLDVTGGSIIEGGPSHLDQAEFKWRAVGGRGLAASSSAITIEFTTVGGGLGQLSDSPDREGAGAGGDGAFITNSDPITANNATFNGGEGLMNSGGHALKIASSANLSLTNLTMVGGNAAISRIVENDPNQTNDAGIGITLENCTNVNVNGGSATGGDALEQAAVGTNEAGKGGGGLVASGCTTLVARNFSSTGGHGGSASEATSQKGEKGGNGLEISGGSAVTLETITATGGDGGLSRRLFTSGDGGDGIVLDGISGSVGLTSLIATGGNAGDDVSGDGNHGGRGGHGVFLKNVMVDAVNLNAIGGDPGSITDGNAGDGVLAQQVSGSIDGSTLTGGNGKSGDFSQLPSGQNGGHGIWLAQAGPITIGSSTAVSLVGGYGGDGEFLSTGGKGGSGLSATGSGDVFVGEVTASGGDGGITSLGPDHPAGNGVDALTGSIINVTSAATSQGGIGNPNGVPWFADSTSTINFLSDTSLTLTSPNGGENWGAGTNHQITWTSNGVTGNVRLEYDAGAPTENGVPWILIDASTPNDGSYLWSVPNNPTSGALVRVSAVNDPGIQDVSDGAFTITGSALAVTRPNGAESFSIGAKENVNWNPGGLSGTVRLEYSTNNGANWSVIQASVANDGKFKWAVPATASAQSLVRVTSNLVPSITDVSDAVFTIGASAFALTNPTGGENWTVGSAHYIQWNPDGLGGTVALWYSTDGGAGWTSIDAATLNDGSFKWFIPNQVTAQAQVRIETNLTPSNADTSGDFTISAPGLLLIRPNGGESFVVGTKESIFWNTGGLSGTVRLEYSTDGGGSFSIIKASVANDGNFRWLVPNDVTAQARVRVSSNSAPSIADTSDNDFAISLTLPKGGQVGELIPEVFGIYQNFPNPFNPSTQIRYDLPEASEVTLKVYNMLGKEVSTLAQGMKPAGIHFSTFDATGLSSGIYIYRIQAKGLSQKVYTQVFKMVYVK